MSSLELPKHATFVVAAAQTAPEDETSMHAQGC